MGGSTPLFTTLLNYRHSAPIPGTEMATGVDLVDSRQEWTNYPVTATVDDLGKDFVLSAKTTAPSTPDRMLNYLLTGVRSLVDAFDIVPRQAALTLPILPECGTNRS